MKIEDLKPGNVLVLNRKLGGAFYCAIVADGKIMNDDPIWKYQKLNFGDVVMFIKKLWQNKETSQAPIVPETIGGMFLTKEGKAIFIPELAVDYLCEQVRSK